MRAMVYYDKNGIVIRDLQQSDAKILTEEEIAQGWDATIDKYEMRLREIHRQRDHQRHYPKRLLPEAL